MAHHTEMENSALFAHFFSKGGDMRSPFLLYKKQTKQGSTWHVRFWDEVLDKYVEGKSTGVLAVGKVVLR